MLKGGTFRTVITGNVNSAENVFQIQTVHNEIQGYKPLEIVHSDCDYLYDDIEDMTAETLDGFSVADLAVIVCDDTDSLPHAGVMLGYCWGNGIPTVLALGDIDEYYVRQLWRPATYIVQMKTKDAIKNVVSQLLL